MVEPREGLDEYVGPLVPVLVAAGDEEVEGFVEIEVVVAVEVTADELVDLLLGDRVKILKLVKGRKFLHVQSVRRDEVRLSLKQMLGFETCQYQLNGKLKQEKTSRSRFQVMQTSKYSTSNLISVNASHSGT